MRLSNAQLRFLQILDGKWPMAFRRCERDGSVMPHRSEARTVESLVRAGLVRWVAAGVDGYQYNGGVRFLHIPPSAIRPAFPAPAGTLRFYKGPAPTTPDGKPEGALLAEFVIPTDHLRDEFERLVGGRDSYGLKRSRKGTYRNPAVARDWKWFQLGAAYQLEKTPCK